MGVLSIEDLQFVEEQYIKKKPIQVEQFFHHCKNVETIAEAVEIPTVMQEGEITVSTQHMNGSSQSSSSSHMFD